MEFTPSGVLRCLDSSQPELVSLGGTATLMALPRSRLTNAPMVPKRVLERILLFTAIPTTLRSSSDRHSMGVTPPKKRLPFHVWL